MSEPKILLFDIETAPIFGAAWRRYDTTLLDITNDWYMLAISYKWYKSKTTHVVALDDFEGYDPESEDDSGLIDELWGLFNEADVVIGHNSDRFDIKKSNARMIIQGFPPYAPFRTIDTLKEARKNFAFTSNRLDDLGEFLGVGRKVKHAGYNMWKGCMSGDPKAWTDMKRYAKQDTVLLEDVYNALQPWIRSTNLGLYVDDATETCPKCAGSDLKKVGKAATNSGIYLRYQCKSCKGYSRGRTKIKGSGNPLTNI